MDEVASDDFFDDTDLDGLPPNTYQELEQRARSSTQPAHAIAPGGSNVHIEGPGRLQRADFPPADDDDPPSSDYGLDDEDVIDLDKPEEEQTVTTRAPHVASRAQDEVTGREHWRQQRYAPSAVQRPFRPPMMQQIPTAALSTPSASVAYVNGLQVPDTAEPLLPKGGKATDIGALQARIAEVSAQLSLREAYYS